MFYLLHFCDLLINKCIAYWFGNCEFDKFSKSSCQIFCEIKYLKHKEKRISEGLYRIKAKKNHMSLKFEDGEWLINL